MTPIDTAELERLADTSLCPFCGRDPYHYVDIGVGMERVAVDCCDLGIGLFQHGDDQLSKVSGLLSILAREVLARRKAEAWHPIETAPKDGSDLLVWYDHDADPYHDPVNPKRITDYAAWADGGDFLDGKGVCVAKWFPSHWKSIGDYGQGYWLPAAFFASENNDYERVVNAIYWRPLPTPPTPEAEGGSDAE